MTRRNEKDHRMTNAQQGAVEAGQAVYSPTVLSVYDIVVLGISNRWLWRCPTPGLIDLYNRNIKARHLDIGVGTGYFLDHATWPVSRPDITLLDLNPNSLAAAARRISRYEPKTVVADVLKPLPLPADMAPFQSVGLCYLLHCLPGSIPEKAAVFDHIKPFVTSGTRVFGATILQGDAPRSRAAQKLMDVYNSKGIFSNSRDTRADLEAALRARFTNVTLTMRGAVAVFEAEVT
jgi:SAM-dependent methyltransferase